MTDEQFRKWLASPEGQEARQWAADNDMLLIYPSVAKMLDDVRKQIDKRAAK